MPDTLRLEQEPSSPRHHHLDGRPVHAGDTLELAVAEGPDERPVFYLELGNGRLREAKGECVGLAEFKLPDAAVLRWPSE